MEQQFHGTSASVMGSGGAAGNGGATMPGAQSIERAAGLLVRVLEGERPSGVGDLATQTGLPKSTASRLLAALERHGLVEQEGNRGRFRPGPVLVRFAHRGLVDGNLIELAQQPLHALAALTGETINLAVPGGPRGVEHLAQVESRHFLGTGQWVGRQVPYHCTANGKVLLAFGAVALPAEEPLPALTPQTIVERPRLDQELARVRRARFATAVDELEPGLAALAAPVFDESGAVVAALSVSGPTLRLSRTRIAELRPALGEQAAGLSRRLGHTNGDGEVHAA